PARDSCSSFPVEKREVWRNERMWLRFGTTLDRANLEGDGIGRVTEDHMKALVWHGKEDIRCDTVTDPEIEDSRDAIVKVTSCAICGSDLHLFHNYIPAMLPGDIMGHEMMGEVVEVGRGVNGKLKKGERIVVPFTIICGECEQCKRGNFSVCAATDRNKLIADKVFGHTTAGLFGYTHLTGGYPGGQ